MIEIASEIRAVRRTPPPEEIEGHDGHDGDPHAPIGLSLSPHYERDSVGSGGFGEYGGRDVYGI